MSALAPGSKAPEFQLQDLEGQKYRLSETPKSGVTVVAFFKATCPTCMMTMPVLNMLYDRHQKDANVRFLSVAQEPEAEARAFAEQYQIEMPVLLDSSPFKVSSEYKLTHVPSIFLVNAEGKIDQTIVGFAKKELESLSERLSIVTGKTVYELFSSVEVPDYKPG